MNPNSDLIDLLRALNDEGAKYLIVGGYAFAMHGRIRATKDADSFVGTNRTMRQTYGVFFASSALHSKNYVRRT